MKVTMEFRNDKQGEIIWFTSMMEARGLSVFALKTKSNPEIDFEEGKVNDVYNKLENASKDITGTITASR